jgi:hypothetical protein
MVKCFCWKIYSSNSMESNWGWVRLEAVEASQVE